MSITINYSHQPSLLQYTSLYQSRLLQYTIVRILQRLTLPLPYMPQLTQWQAHDRTLNYSSTQWTFYNNSLTNSVGQSPSREANSRPGCHGLLWHPMVHHRIHKSTPSDPILNCRALVPHIRFNIIPQSTHKSPKQFLPLHVSWLKLLSRHSHSCCMSCTTMLVNFNNKIIELLMKFSIASCFFFHLRITYSPQHLTHRPLWIKTWKILALYILISKFSDRHVTIELNWTVASSPRIEFTLYKAYVKQPNVPEIY